MNQPEELGEIFGQPENEQEKAGKIVLMQNLDGLQAASLIGICIRCSSGSKTNRKGLHAARVRLQTLLCEWFIPLPRTFLLSGTPC